MTDENASATALSLTQEAASRAGLSTKDMTRVVESLRDTLVSCALRGDSVAVPRFGTFAAVKEDERVSRDISTGHNVLLPPHLELRFTPAASLRHTVNGR